MGRDSSDNTCNDNLNQSRGLHEIFSSSLSLSPFLSEEAHNRLNTHKLIEGTVSQPSSASNEVGNLPKPIDPNSAAVTDPDLLTQSPVDLNSSGGPAVPPLSDGEQDKTDDTDEDEDTTVLKSVAPSTLGTYTDPVIIALKMKAIDDMLLQLSTDSKGVNTTVAGLEKSLEFSHQEIKDLRKENADLKTRLDALELEDKRSQFQAKLVDDKLYRLETTTKRKNLIFEGVPEIDGKREDVVKTIGSLFDQLKVHQGINFDACFRMGPYNKSRTRPILVSFERQTDRDLIYSRRMDMRHTQDFNHVWINEDLGAASKRKRGLIRMIAKEAQNQGVDCRTGKFSLVVNNQKIDEDNLDDLPPSLHPTSLKQVQIDKSTVAYQSEFAPFSNFFPCIVQVGQHKLFCLEQALQFMKAKTLNKPLAATKIYLSRNVRFIKQLGSELGTSDAWEARKFDVMYGLLKKKSDQHPPLKALLLRTAGLQLVEATPDRTWGCGATLSSNVLRRHEWPGRNKHREILMTVRDEYLLMEKNWLIWSIEPWPLSTYFYTGSEFPEPLTMRLDHPYPGLVFHLDYQ